MFAVVYETPFKTKILFEGTHDECVDFQKKNPELCSTYSFIQELEEDYA